MRKVKLSLVNKGDVNSSSRLRGSCLNCHCFPRVALAGVTNAEENVITPLTRPVPGGDVLSHPAKFFQRYRSSTSRRWSSQYIAVSS